EMRALPGQALEALAVQQVVAVAEQDQTVSLVAVLVLLVPVARALLERDQQVVAALRAGARDRAQHGDAERVDGRVVRGRSLEDEQRDRVGALKAQVGGVLVDAVVELLRDREHPSTGLLAYPWAAAQRARDGRLRDAGLVRNVK